MGRLIWVDEWGAHGQGVRMRELDCLLLAGAGTPQCLTCLPRSILAAPPHPTHLTCPTSSPPLPQDWRAGRYEAYEDGPDAPSSVDRAYAAKRAAVAEMAELGALGSAKSKAAPGAAAAAPSAGAWGAPGAAAGGAGAAPGAAAAAPAGVDDDLFQIGTTVHRDVV